ncbi:MAG: metal-dependent hydrolase [Sphingomonadaceae bacterium]
MSIVVRFPKFDFSRVPRFWARNRAFVYDRCATSLIPTPVEPWLIRICQAAVEQLGPEDEVLKEEVKAFIGQESQHFRQHRLFNKAIAENGYPGLAEIEQRLADDLADFEKNRSLKFLLAYADGFESMGAVSAQLWFNEFDEFLDGADPNAVALWGWHLAEEFEHREVMFKFYKALFCRGFVNSIINGYFYRIYGLWFAMKHLGGYTGKMVRYMVKQDMPDMTEDDRARLKADREIYMKQYKNAMLPKLARNLLPWYNPGKKTTPKGLAAYLRRFEPGGDMARTAARPSSGSAPA